MKLYEWLHKYEVSQKDFAKQVHITTNTMSSLVREKRSAGLSLGLRIHWLTNKEVSLASLLSKKEFKYLEKYFGTEITQL